MNAINHTTILFAIARAVHFAACLMLPCVLVFDRFIVDHDSRDGELVRQRWPAIARGLVWLAMPLALASGIAWLGFVTMDLNDVPFTAAMHADLLRGVVNQTHFGELWKCRGVVGIAVAALLLPATIARPGSFARAAFSWLALPCSMFFAVSLCRAGHGADGSRWHQFADASHILIAIAWPTALLPLVLLQRRLLKETGLEKWVAISGVVWRFSVMSFLSVVLLIVTGVANSWPLLGKLSQTLASAYGRTLAVKVGLFAVMILLGALNMLFLRPRLSLDFAGSSPVLRERALSRLRLSIWIEVLLYAGVLLAVGLLGTLMPACDMQNCSCCD